MESGITLTEITLSTDELPEQSAVLTLEGPYQHILGLRLSDDGENLIFRVTKNESVVKAHEWAIEGWEKKDCDKRGKKPVMGVSFLALKLNDDKPFHIFENLIPMGNIDGWSFCVFNKGAGGILGMFGF